MKFLACTLAAAALAVALPARATEAHDHKPRHGGIVVGGTHMDLELVARPERIVVHVSDHGKKGNTAGATGKLTLLNGKVKTEALLQPAGDDRLEAAGPFTLGPGTKVVASVVLANKKSANARFTLK